MKLSSEEVQNRDRVGDLRGMAQRVDTKVEEGMKEELLQRALTMAAIKAGSHRRQFTRLMAKKLGVWRDNQH